MTRNRWIARILFVAATFGIMGISYGLAYRTGMFRENNGNSPSNTDPWKVVQEINRRFENRGVLMQSGNIKLFDIKQPEKTLERYDFSYYLGTDKIYSRVGPAETYCDKELLIAADEENRTLSVGLSDSALLKIDMPGLKQLKEILKKVNGELKIIEEEGREVLYFRSELETDIKSYRVYYDPVSYQVEAVKMEVWKEDAFLQEKPEPLIMEIRFTNLKRMEGFPEAFGRSRFIKLSGDSLILQPAYADFEFVNDVMMQQN